MKPESSWPCTQDPATGPYPEPANYSPHTHILFAYDRFNNILRLGHLFPSGFPTKILYALSTI
jgi:hypothetical protein